MIVKVFTVNQDTGAQTFVHHSELRDCFPDDDQNDTEYQNARDEIGQVGRAWIGGGAAPLFLVVLP
jgi:hypothetical protein